MKNFSERVREQLAEIDRRGLRRRAREVTGPQGGRLWIDGRHVLCLCSNNYLGLAGHPALLSAVREALDLEGLGAGASRQISGNMRIHRQAERSLASFVGHPASALFAAGYLANVGALQALAQPGDLVFSDRLNHASLIDGCRLSRAQVVIYEHRDAADLTRKLRDHRHRGRGALIVTEALFSMDGDAAPLDQLARIAREFEAGLVVDEAHALGVLGPEGRGVCAQLGVQPDVTIGTLGKAFGSQGAFVAASEEVVELIRNRARSYVFSTAPSPALSAAALSALQLVREADGLRAKLREHARRLRAGLRALEYRLLDGDSPIIPVMIGEAAPTMELSNALFECGVFVHGVRPPTVPAGTARLRLVPMASHTDEDMEEALAAFAEARR